MQLCHYVGLMFQEPFHFAIQKVKNELRRYLTYTVRLIAPLKLDIMIVRDIYVYMYVCMYVRMYVCMHACMYVCMYVYIQIFFLKKTYVCLLLYIYICLRMFISTYVYMFV